MKLQLFMLFLLGICGTESGAITRQAQVTGQDRTQQTVLTSVSKMSFNDKGFLFLGDGRRPVVYSIDLGGKISDQPTKPFNLKNVDLILSRFLGVSTEMLRVTDMAVHPLSKDVYLAVSVGVGKLETFSLIKVRPEGKLENVSLKDKKVDSVELTHHEGKDYKFWNKYQASSLSITHIEYYKNHLYVSGLKTGEFSSTLYKVSFPFRGNVEHATVSYYHAVHDQTESRAPIISHKIVHISGKDYLLAVYTCTPLVLIPLSEIKNGAHIRGKTIAELGYGNNPVDMLSFTLDRGEGMQPYILINNRNRSGSLIAMKDIIDAESQPGITTPSGFSKKGVTAQDVPLAGVIHMSLQDASWLLALRRNIDTGHLDLITMVQGVWLRLSDFISEYNFPDYQYPDSQKEKKSFHNYLKSIEGFL